MKDRISGLPVEILVHILSFLPLKSAARCGSLSTTWRHLWKFVPSLSFDYKVYGDLSTRKFLGCVNRVLDLYQGPTLDEFRICRILGAAEASLIDDWIRFAMAKKVKRMDLNFCLYVLCVDLPSSMKYKFPSVETITSVEYLSLNSCILTLPGIDKFKSLKKVDLIFVEMSEEVLQGLLSNCSSLEYLSLKYVDNLVCVKVDASSSNLKCLVIRYCAGLKCVDINALNLIIFTYVGLQQVHFKVSAPHLIEVSFSVSNYSSDDRLTYFGNQLANNLSQLEKLVLEVTPHEIGSGIGTLPTLCNLKDLVLWISSEQDNVTALVHLLNLSPLLRRFELHFMSLRKQLGPSQIESTSKCAHQHLEEVQIGGFSGFEDEIQLLEHVVKNATGMKKIVLDPYIIRIIDSDKRFCPSSNTESRLQTARKHAQHLCERIPSSIDAVIL